MKMLLILSIIISMSHAYAKEITVTCHEGAYEDQNKTNISAFRIELGEKTSKVDKFDSYYEMIKNENVQESHEVATIVSKGNLSGYLIVPTRSYLLEYDAEDYLVLNILGESFVNAVHINTDTGGIIHKLQCEILKL